MKTLLDIGEREFCPPLQASSVILCLSQIRTRSDFMMQKKNKNKVLSIVKLCFHKNCNGRLKSAWFMRINAEFLFTSGGTAGWGRRRLHRASDQTSSVLLLTGGWAGGVVVVIRGLEHFQSSESAKWPPHCCLMLFYSENIFEMLFSSVPKAFTTTVLKVKYRLSAGENIIKPYGHAGGSQEISHHSVNMLVLFTWKLCTLCMWPDC